MIVLCWRIVCFAVFIALMISLCLCVSLVLVVVCGVILAILTSSGPNSCWLLLLLLFRDAVAILFWKKFRIVGAFASHPLGLGGSLAIVALNCLRVGMSILCFMR